ncbi:MULTISPECIES: exopolysaccharide biosynthesis polyprenyl glycosylphosphotransferase [unclassified Candidatus Frackibacter]|uniref:exopolysaccharide biosynthesis polyprenyl glycosylphosphotransferase n=1 Tax=unclassified Candidatus Frackibacter TaxID=2648818 RepID=UPI00088456C3|nr:MULTISPECIES: exopolysaccharide biosynthesis polyprenyl glycosylphosphotransferase [unclassified Candidatus Frackibacter]SDC47039.1 exopolysaccharide biosynthesis polyprenyl glycosylphosphotransferase [Candidatus Frackibacter sp. WG11]SEM81575.1 exopolysaccharide biosynthesis polyprenyl glycosylphosphotransferase [Candidatus Frackibacter sp. WG12]SFL72447.1 exopolysaccharide biosynthesis polyprenyl glycosylphosphotransferase [Candidatus Frackibacter sp. WG13]
MSKIDSEIVNSRVKEVWLKRKRSKKFSYQSYLIIKRLLDIIVSLTGLILTLPLILIVAITIKVETPGPIIFKQSRLGLAGEEFTIYKFRSMIENAEEKTGPVWAQKDDPRITKVGHFIRKKRIDEIPQFVNVLKGEMSLVGPRPEREIFIKKFSDEHPSFKNRLLIKPGITGLAQVTGGYELTPRQKTRLDLLYIHNQGLILDIKILLKTVLVVILEKGVR